MTQRLDYPKLSHNSYKTLFELTTVAKAGSIDKTLVDLINIRASLLNGCAFCVDMHIKEAKIHGERELRLFHVPIWRESTLFTDRERAALEWTEAVTKVSEHGVPDDIYDRVRTQFSEQEVSDLTFLIAIINSWNRLAISFRSVPGSADAALGIANSGLAA